MKRLFLLFLALMLSICTIASAHSGRTDSSGGHNKTSDGTYHYHCDGHPAHQHSNGVCPYDKTVKATATPRPQTTTRKSISTSKPTSTPKPIVKAVNSQTTTEVFNYDYSLTTAETFFTTCIIVGILIAVLYHIVSMIKEDLMIRKYATNLEEEQHDFDAGFDFSAFPSPVFIDKTVSVQLQYEQKKREEKALHLQKMVEYHKKAEERRAIITPYQGKTLRSLCDIPAGTYISSDGLPCEIGHLGHGDWGAAYTRCITQTTNRAHRPNCRYASKYDMRIHVCYCRQYCKVCKSQIDELVWYKRYLQEKEYCERMHINIKFD